MALRMAVAAALGAGCAGAGAGCGFGRRARCGYGRDRFVRGRQPARGQAGLHVAPADGPVRAGARDRGQVDAQFWASCRAEGELAMRWPAAGSGADSAATGAAAGAAAGGFCSARRSRSAPRSRPPLPRPCRCRWWPAAYPPARSGRAERAARPSPRPRRSPPRIAPSGSRPWRRCRRAAPAVPAPPATRPACRSPCPRPGWACEIHPLCTILRAVATMPSTPGRAACSMCRA